MGVGGGSCILPASDPGRRMVETTVNREGMIENAQGIVLTTNDDIYESVDFN
jgi:hypothetical protein